MANIRIKDIQISDLYASGSFSPSEWSDLTITLTLSETERIIGGMSLDTGFQVGLGMVSSGIGLVAMVGLGPVGLFAGGFLYGGGLVLSMYTAYHLH